MAESGCATSKGGNSPTRWGIIGAGRISNDFCLALRTLPEIEHKIVAVAARKQEDADKFAKRHNICHAYGSYECIALDPNIDVVYIGIVTGLHAEISIRMLRAGKHVLCEKPMAISAAQAKTVLEVAKESDRLFVEGLWSKFFPAYEQLKTELFEKKTVGSVKALSIHFGFDLVPTGFGSLGSKEIGDGTTLGLGCYALQMANLIFNMEKPEKIFVHGSLFPTGTDKAFSATLQYKDERIAQFYVASDCRLSNKALVYGTNGMIEIPMFWCPTELKTPHETFTYELPRTSEPTRFDNSAGFVFEIKAVREAMLHGLTEIPAMTHTESLLISNMMDEFLKQLGVTYA